MKIDDSAQTNWAIMGLGNMANTFAKALCATPGANIVAAASRSKEKADEFARKYSIPNSYSSYEAMLKDEKLCIDIVYIATPNFCHYENIKMSLMYNKNTMCEKPIVMKSKELEELRELASSKNLLLTEGLWTMYLPTFRKAEEWIAEGRIGDIQGIRADLSKREVINPSNIRFSGQEGSGALWDIGIYPIAFAANYIDSELSISYVNSIQHKRGFDKDWTIILSGDHFSATITTSFDFEGSRKAVIIGESGSIVWTPQFNRTNTVSLYNSEGKLSDTFSAEYFADGFEYEIAEIQECLRERRIEAKTVPLNVSQRILRIMESLQAKAASWIFLPT